MAERPSIGVVTDIYIQAERIFKINGTIENVLIEVDSGIEPNPILGKEPARNLVIVSGAVVRCLWIFWCQFLEAADRRRGSTSLSVRWALAN